MRAVVVSLAARGPVVPRTTRCCSDLMPIKVNSADGRATGIRILKTRLDPLGPGIRSHISPYLRPVNVDIIFAVIDFLGFKVVGRSNPIDIMEREVLIPIGGIIPRPVIGQDTTTMVAIRVANFSPVAACGIIRSHPDCLICMTAFTTITGRETFYIKVYSPSAVSSAAAEHANRIVVSEGRCAEE